MNRTRGSIVQYLRTEAATLLWFDADILSPDDMARVDDVVTVLESYADAIESGEDLNPSHPLICLLDDGGWTD